MTPRLDEFIRPSALPALELCAGRAALEARAVEQCPALLRMSSPQAEQGTLGHAVVAQTLSLIFNSPAGWQEPAFAMARMAHVIDALQPWTADAVRRCVTYAVALVEREVAEGWDISVEVEMHLPGSRVGIPRGGTADVVILCRFKGSPRIGRLIIQDHKLGFLDQGEAVSHRQLHGYAVMGWMKYEPVHDCEIHLAQGRRREFSAAKFDAKSIYEIADEIRDIVELARRDDAEVKPSLDACRYCKALCFCRAVRDRIMSTVHEAQLFGIDTRDRVKLADDAALAARFSEEARALAKAWVQENQGVAAEPAPEKEEQTQ